MPKYKFNIACGILAGGKNTRISGIDKAFIKYNDIPLIDNILSKLTTVFDEIIIVTNSPEKYNYNNCIITSDIYKNIGPLGGIYTALAKSTKESVFIFSCDMPFLNINLIIKQIIAFNKSNKEIFIPQIEDNIEPLHAIYKKSLTGKLKDYIDNTKDYSVRNYILGSDYSYFNLKNTKSNKISFTNINTLSDIELLKI